MSTDLARLGFAVDSGPLGRAVQWVKKLGQEGKKTGQEVETATGKMNSSLKRLAIGFGGLAAAATVARSAFNAGETYTRMNNTLRAMGLSAVAATAALSDVGDIATRTRAPLEATATLYQRVSVAGKDLGASQADVLRFTENVGLALGATGTSANEAAGALLQLSQALAGGVVRAEEFNSILEGAYPIAQAAANAIDEAGGSVGRLRTLVNEGKISSQEFFEAILNSTDALEAAFGSTVPTVSQGLTVLSTAFTLTVGEMNSMVGATTGIAEVLILLAENLDRVIAYGIAAAGVFGVTYVAGLVAAAGITGTLTGALTLLRRALFATGIGAIVVAAGELVYWFIELIKKTGDFGSAMSLLGEVASGVWSGIGTSAKALVPALQATWKTIQAGFMTMLATISKHWADFLHSVSAGLENMPGFDAAAIAVNNTAIKAGSAVYEFDSAAEQAAGSARNLRAEAAALATQGFEEARAAAAKLTAQVEQTAEAAGSGAEAADRLAEALAGQGAGAGPGGGSGGSGGGVAGAAGAVSEAAKEAKKSLDELKSAAESWTDRTATPIEKYRKELEELTAVADAGLLDGTDTYARGVRALNVELADSLPLIGEITDSLVDGLFNGFKGTLSSIADIFKRWLAQMIATAAKNQIIIAMGGSLGGVGGVAGAASGIGGMGGALGSALGGLGTAFMGGASSFLSTGFAGLGSTLAGATSGLTGLATAAGALALPIAGAVAAFSFFRTKTKKLDEGIRLTTNNIGVSVDKWEKIRKSRFWGLSSSRSTNFEAADAEIADPLRKAIREIRGSIQGAARALGVSGKTFRNFTHEINLSTKGMSDDEALAALQAELAGLGNAFARMIPHVNSLRKSGESATDALIRTATNLQGVNQVLYGLRFDKLEKSLRGGRTANTIADLAGGVDALASSAEFYMKNIMSLKGQVMSADRLFKQGLRAANVQRVPETEAQFRKIVKQNMAWGNEEKAMRLMQLAPLFVELQNLRAEFDRVGDSAGDSSARLAEREGLLQRIWRLTDNTTAARKAELAATLPANRALLKRIYHLEDVAEREAALEARNSERLGLVKELRGLLGQTNALRAMELRELHPANRALQERIWKLEDSKAAEEAAAEAAAERAETAKRVADERLGLESQLLQLQGNTAELRRRELDALDPTNRSLQKMVWGLEDAKAAMDALDPEAFATKLDFDRARGSLINSQGRSNPYMGNGIFNPAVVPPSQRANNGEAMVAEIRDLKKELKLLREQQSQLQRNGNADLRRLRNIEERREVIGTPTYTVEAPE